MSTQLEKIRADENKFIAVCDLIKVLGICAIIGILGWRLIAVFSEALQSKPAVLNAFSHCFSEWNLTSVLWMLATGVTGGGWWLDHRRNNKLVRDKGMQRHELERNDPVNSRSGLDEIGATPKPPRRKNK